MIMNVWFPKTDFPKPWKNRPENWTEPVGELLEESQCFMYSPLRVLLFPLCPSRQGRSLDWLQGSMACVAQRGSAWLTDVRLQQLKSWFRASPRLSLHTTHKIRIAFPRNITIGIHTLGGQGSCLSSSLIYPQEPSTEPGTQWAGNRYSSIEWVKLSALLDGYNQLDQTYWQVCGNSFLPHLKSPFV